MSNPTQQLIFIAANSDPEINHKILELSSHGFGVNNGTLLEQSLLLIPKSSIFILLANNAKNQAFIELGIALCNLPPTKICIIGTTHCKYYGLFNLRYYINWDNFVIREFFS